MPKDYPPGSPLEELKVTCKEHNEQLLKRLREDVHVTTLVREMELEAKQGLMTGLTSADTLDHEAHRFASRFGIEQGYREDGTPKVRACDNETESGCNGATQPTEKLRCDGVDWVCALAATLHSFGVKCMRPWKADVNKAYRRIPVHPDDHWLMWVCLLVGNKPMVARHNAMPFGAVGPSISFVALLHRSLSFISPLQQVACTLGIEWVSVCRRGLSTSSV